MGISFIILTGCPYSAVLLSFRNSPQKLTKIHVRTAAAPAFNTTTPCLPPNTASPCLTMLVCGVGAFSSHHPLCTMALPWGGGRQLVISCFGCWSPCSITVLFSTGPCDCHLLMIAGWKSISKPAGVTAVANWSSGSRLAGNPETPWGFQREANINALKITTVPVAAGWPKPHLTETHHCICQFGITWLSLAHASPSKMKMWAKGYSLCCGSSAIFPLKRKFLPMYKKRKQ